MKLTGKFKTQVDHAPTKEEKREAIKQTGMLLSNGDLDQVAGGGGPQKCICKVPKPNPKNPTFCRECGFSVI